MTQLACAAPVPWETLVGYWLADPEIDPATQTAVEEHLFGCAACSGTLAGLAALGDALRRRFRGENLQPVVTRAMLAGLMARGLRVTEADIPSGRTWEASLPPDTDFVVARLPVDLTAAARLDVEICAPDGVPFYVVRDAPFDAASGEVLVLCHRHTAASNPQLLLKVHIAREGGATVMSEHALVSRVE